MSKLFHTILHVCELCKETVHEWTTKGQTTPSCNGNTGLPLFQADKRVTPIEALILRRKRRAGYIYI